MTGSRPLHRRERAYLVVVGGAAVLGILLKVAADDSWDCDQVELCRPGLADYLATAAYLALFAAALCTVVEVAWRSVERHRGDGDQPPLAQRFTAAKLNARLEIYVLGVCAVTALGFWIGGATYGCPADATDCDLGVYAAFGAGVYALVGALALVVVIEIVLAVRRRRQ